MFAGLQSRRRVELDELSDENAVKCMWRGGRAALGGHSHENVDLLVHRSWYKTGIFRELESCDDETLCCDEVEDGSSSFETVRGAFWPCLGMRRTHNV